MPYETPKRSSVRSRAPRGRRRGRRRRSGRVEAEVCARFSSFVRQRRAASAGRNSRRVALEVARRLEDVAGERVGAAGPALIDEQDVAVFADRGKTRARGRRRLGRRFARAALEEDERVGRPSGRSPASTTTFSSILRPAFAARSSQTENRTAPRLALDARDRRREAARAPAPPRPRGLQRSERRDDRGAPNGSDDEASSRRIAAWCCAAASRRPLSFSRRFLRTCVTIRIEAEQDDGEPDRPSRRRDPRTARGRDTGRRARATPRPTRMTPQVSDPVPSAARLRNWACRRIRLGELSAVDRLGLPHGVDDREEPDECDQRAEELAAAAVRRHADADDERAGEREGPLVETQVQVPEAGEHRQKSRETPATSSRTGHRKVRRRGGGGGGGAAAAAGGGGIGSESRS